MKEKVLIFGAGICGNAIARNLDESSELIGFLDNDCRKWGKEIPGGYLCFSPEMVQKIEFDIIILGTMVGLDEVRNQLHTLGVNDSKIVSHLVSSSVRAREIFLNNFSQICRQKNLPGSTAEVGVFRGEFAKHINLCFPDRQLYLFDTFEGFSEKDIKLESEASDAGTGHFSNTSVDLVMGKMKFPKMCSIQKGYFPDSIHGLEDTFCFVNLDVDLYKPTLEGLKYFAPRMAAGGCILVHDYFSSEYPNVRKAVEEFADSHGNGLGMLPIGDGLSMAMNFY